ncbi:hypothetical protein [Devosia sp. CN2-171]|uniref:hypothetical protein n=1 Tax=Devosia sp. CN2-171 TaxID=3400909 RepID=UPI003BF8A513
MPEHLIFCGSDAAAAPPYALRLNLSGPSQNLQVRLGDLGQKLVKDVPDRLVDLVDIAAYVYGSDLAYSRGGPVARQMGVDWRRDFKLVVPVRDPDHWQSQDIREGLESTLRFLSDDNYRFDFQLAPNDGKFPEYLSWDEADAKAFRPDEVVLFSGGLDSLSGVIEELATTSKRLALVSHRPSSKVYAHQKLLVAALTAAFPGRLMHIPVLINRMIALPVSEYTQRTRSFLYVSMAAAIAHMFDLGRVRFYENGVISINLPISEQVIGTRATRTTHPLTLSMFTSLMSAILSSPVDVENPFAWNTKAEVIAKIVRHGFGELIRHSVSCSKIQEMTQAHTHCGCCSQCIDRRFGVLASGAEEYDPSELYTVDLLIGARDHGIDRTMAESYVRAHIDMHSMSELAFAGKYGSELGRICLASPGQPADEIVRKVMDLHRRHGSEVAGVVERGLHAFGPQLLRGEVPQTSILRMALAPNEARRTIPDAAGVWLARETALVTKPLSPEMTRKPKDMPSRARAMRAILELYPEGVPNTTDLPNKLLCNAVMSRIGGGGLGVSSDTILRAAGRRK